MKFPPIYLAFIIIFGLLLLYSYYELLNKTKSIETFWGAIKGNLRTFYMISLVIIICAFICTLFYLMFSSNFSEQQNYQLFTALFGITIFSLFWLPLSILYVHYPKNKIFLRFLIVITLLLVSLSALYFVYLFYPLMQKEKSIFANIVFYSMIYLFCHVFFLDCIFWSYFFFLENK